MNIGINVTKKCNLRCPECYLLDGINKLQGINTDIDLNRLKLILSPLEIDTISLCGGEPLLYLELKKMITFLRLKARNITLATNGLLIDNYADFLIEKDVKIQWSIRENNPQIFPKIEYYISKGMCIEAYYLPEKKHDFLKVFFNSCPSVEKIRILYNSKNSLKSKEWHETLKDINIILSSLNKKAEVEIGFLPKSHKIANKFNRGANNRIFIDSDCKIYNCPLMVGRVKGTNSIHTNTCTPETCPVLKKNLDDKLYLSVCTFLLADLANAIDMIEFYENK